MAGQIPVLPLPYRYRDPTLWYCSSSCSSNQQAVGSPYNSYGFYRDFIKPTICNLDRTSDVTDAGCLPHLPLCRCKILQAHEEAGAGIVTSSSARIAQGEPGGLEGRAHRGSGWVSVGLAGTPGQVKPACLHEGDSTPLLS